MTGPVRRTALSAGHEIIIIVRIKETRPGMFSGVSVMSNPSASKWLPFLICLAAVLFMQPDLAGQTEEQSEEPQIDVAALLSDLEAECSKWDDRDEDSIKYIFAMFAEAYPDMAETDKKKVVNAVKGVFRHRPAGDNRRLLIEAADTLAFMEDPGRKALQTILKSSKLKPPKNANRQEALNHLVVKAAVIKSIGTFKDPKTVKFFLDLVDHKESEIINAACDALANFRELPVSKRKPIVDKLIKRYSHFAQSGYEPGNKSWEKGRRNPRKLSNEQLWEVSGGFNRALQALTGQEISNAEMWRIWFQAHKKDRTWTKIEFENKGNNEGGCPHGHGK